MDDLITIFFSTHFTEEQQILSYKALGLINSFGLTSVNQAVVGTIMREGDDHIENIVDQVHGLIEEGIDRVIFRHRITLENSPTLSFKVSLLEGIFGLAYREFYQPYQLCLEDYTSSDEEKLAFIISDITGLEETDILEHLVWVFPGTMRRLQDLIESKITEESVVSDLELLKTIRRNLVIFQAAFGLPKAIEGLSKSNVALGSTFEIYYDLFKNEIIDFGDLESTTWRLIWLALISSNGTQNPQLLLLDKSPELFNDISTVNSFNTMVQKAMGHYQEFKANFK